MAGGPDRPGGLPEVIFQNFSRIGLWPRVLFVFGSGLGALVRGGLVGGWRIFLARFLRAIGGGPIFGGTKIVEASEEIERFGYIWR